METQRCIGELTAKANRLIEDVGRQGDRLQKLERVVWGAGITVVVAVGVTVFWLGERFSALMEAIGKVAVK